MRQREGLSILYDRTDGSESGETVRSAAVPVPFAPPERGPTIDRRPRILIVDDDAMIRDLLCRRLMGEGYQCDTAVNGTDALDRLRTNDYELMLTDIRMPGMDGIELLEETRNLDPDMQVIMVTGVAGTNEAVKAMKLGAYDYVMKPFDLEYVVMNVRRSLESRTLLRQNKMYQLNLENRVGQATKDLMEKNEQIQTLLLSTITSFVHVLEAKDTYTEGHSRRVADRAATVARQCHLTGEQIEDIQLAGLLHDIGKVGIREETLQKPGKLSAEEYDEVKTHPLIAERILHPIEELRKVILDIKYHHERYDGRGYPSGLKGEEIPFGARILAVVDAYDAITSERPYRSAFNHDYALSEIEKYSGSQFDPLVAQAFLSI